jgi:sulfoxide reductase heme-binding subunit YedZ
MTPRLARRLWRHHLPLGVASAVCGWALYVTRPYPDVITRLSFATAYPALALLAATLMIGPWRTLAGKAVVISLDLRRDVGIWAGILGVAHTGIGQCVHMRGRPWLYYVYENWRAEHWQPVRHDLFGAANFTGLFAALVLIALLATSNDASLRKLGTPGWKQLQRWNYGCFGLTALHCFLYQLGVESQQAGFVAAAIACVTIAAALQLLGWRRRAIR